MNCSPFFSFAFVMKWIQLSFYYCFLLLPFLFPSPSLSLPLLWRPWETQGKRGIQYQVLIHTHHHTEGKNVGSGAAQFRLDSAIDGMLYQPLPWQLSEQGQSRGIYLHLSPTPCHLVLVFASLCWFECHLKWVNIWCFCCCCFVNAICTCFPEKNI